MRRRVGERVISACVVPTVKHGGEGGVMVLAGDTVCDLFRIQGTLNQHGYQGNYLTSTQLRWYGMSWTAE